MSAFSRAPSGKTISAIGPGVAAALLVCWILFTRGGEILAALAACPAWVIVAAVAAHLTTLLLRTEAWRAVLAAAGGESLPARTVHAANAGAFLVGTVQGHAALPTRIALLRHLGGSRSPAATQIALADAPILGLEICSSAMLAAVAATAVTAIPAWIPALLLVTGIGALIALRLACWRFRDRPLAAGLRILAAPAGRARLTAIVLAFTAAALARTWVVLSAFGLPSDPASVALLLLSMGAIGLLPLGVAGTGPAATIATLGPTDMAGAAAAGLVISGAAVCSVCLYATGAWVIGASAGEGDLEPIAEPSNVIAFPRAAEPEVETELAA